MTENRLNTQKNQALDPDARITDVRCTIVRLPVVRPIGDGCQTVAIVEVDTNIGITGLGEAHTNPLVTKSIIDSPMCHSSTNGLRNVLVGENPFDIQHLWDKMRAATLIFGRRGAGVHAISAVDIALWDILGKACGLPIWRLLGGRSRSIDVYASDLSPASLDGAIETAKRHVDSGYPAVKFGWGQLGGNRKNDAQFVKEIRKTVGDDIDIMVDLGLPTSFDNARYLSDAFADDGVFFLEEPLAPDDIDGYRKLVDYSPTPIATGEKDDTLAPFIELIDRGGLNIIQPDVARVGGISEALRILHYAEAKRVAVIPHCWSTDILVAATLQIISVSSLTPYLEFNVTDNPIRRNLCAVPFVPQDGRIAPTEKPGLGVELNRDFVEEYRWEM